MLRGGVRILQKRVGGRFSSWPEVLTQSCCNAIRTASSSVSETTKRPKAPSWLYQEGQLYQHGCKNQYDSVPEEDKTWRGLVALTVANFSVFAMWRCSYDDSHQEFMLKNFTNNVTNLKEGRLWVLLTACFSHERVGHLMYNMAALWLFGFKVYRFLKPSVVMGMPGFLWLYVVCGLSGSVAHVVANLISGRLGPTLSVEERRRLDPVMPSIKRGWLEQSKEQAQEAEEARMELADKIARQDLPSLGASGAILGIAATAAAWFPHDKVKLQVNFVPLPAIVATYVLVATVFQVSETVGSCTSNGVDHAGHLGGSLAGAACASYLWYFILPCLGRVQPGPLPLVLWWRKG